MAVSKALVVASLFISLFLLQLLVQADDHQNMVKTNGYYGGGSLDCGVACKARCSEASRWKICMRACGTCCARCQCVPPGTSGNEDVCPCYATMTTHDGRHKCP